MCPACGSRTHATLMIQGALFRQCGYGADLAVTVRWCPACPWTIETDRSERRPS